MALKVPVREVMTREVVTEPPEATVEAAVERLRAENVGSVVVVDGDRVVGILTDDDFLGLLTGTDWSPTAPIESVMSSPVETIPPSASIVRAAARLRDLRLDQLAVVEDGRLVGLVSAADLATFLPQYALHNVDETATAARDWSYEYEDRGAAGIDVGDVVRFEKTIREVDVERFAAVSGDENPLHTDASFAERTRFGRRVVHGLLAASLFSAALAHLPGLVIYLSQDVHFLGPVAVGERLAVSCEVIQDLGHDRYRLSTTATDESGERVLLGEAVVLVDPLPDERADAG